jgi:trimeric autotransporter adhesin
MKTTGPTILMIVSLVCLTSLPRVQAVVPPPDGGYPNFTTAEGQNALFSLTTGAANTAVGWSSLKSVTTGGFNTGVGAGTLLFNTGDANTALGAAALLFNTNGFDNTAIGAAALQNNTTGGFNTANGANALANNTAGIFNTANGANALRENTLGSDNTASGHFALLSNTTGSNNTAIGHSALLGNTGSSNTAMGVLAGANLSTGSGNVCIGEDVRGTAGQSNTTRIRNIGSTPIIDGTTVVIGSTGGVGDGILGYPASSRRYKEEIKPMDRASETLFALKPVTFRARGNIDAARIKHYGLIAEEVATVDRDLVVYNPEGKPETLRFDSISAMLLNEFLKEHRKVEKLEAIVADLAAELRQVKTQVQMSTPAMRVAAENP